MTLCAFRLGRLVEKSRVNPFRHARAFHDYSLELGYPIPCKEPKWCTAEEAMEILESDMFVFSHGAAATPTKLLEAMVQRGKECCLKNITVGHMHTDGIAPQADPDCEGIFRDLSFFMGGNIRKAVAEGRADNLSIFLHEIPLVFYKGIYKPDIALISVSVPDRHGYVTLGTSVDCARAATTYAKYIIAQVNPQMPRTFGDTHIHISHIDYAVCVDTPLYAIKEPKLSEVDIAIGKNVAENLIEDGATLQMGIGTIPDAVLAQLGNHKYLGIHSEMIAGGAVDLVATGAVTNCQKPTHKGRTVGSFMNGTQRLYDWLNDNPSVAMMRVDYVNAAYVIRTMPKMTAINSAIEIDLTGQVCADSIGPRMYSGFGGQVDFIKGAGEAFDMKGKPIVALPSTTKKGESKIIPFLKKGAGVVTSRAHNQYVVTEYGVASLFSKTLRQKAYQLIQIAHPDHREKLEKAAFERLKCMPCPY